jgi:molecular chaperone HscB
MTNDHFQRLGLPRRLALHLPDLESAYLTSSRTAHPDYFSGSSAEEQEASELLSSQINEAYAVLKDPFRRAEHLLALHGGPTASEVKDIPPIFLMEMMEQRERIEAASEAEKAIIEAELKVQYDAVFVKLAPMYEASPVNVVGIRKELNAAKYLRGMLRDLRGA